MQTARVRISKEVSAIRHSLHSLDRSLRRLVPLLSGAVSMNGSPEGNRRSRLSANARASMVLQGRYIGHMRHLKPKQKALVRKIRETKGVRAAIARARKLAQV